MAFADLDNSVPGSPDLVQGSSDSHFEMAGQSNRLEEVEEEVKDVNSKFDSFLEAVTSTGAGRPRRPSSRSPARPACRRDTYTQPLHGRRSPLSTTGPTHTTVGPPPPSTEFPLALRPEGTKLQ